MDTPATPTQKKSNFKKILQFLPILAIIAFYGFVLLKSGGNVDAAKVGDCTSLKAANEKTPYTVKDCSDSEAQYKVIDIITSEQRASGKNCKTVPGTTNTVTSAQGNLCMIAKNDNPANGINTIKVGDCMNVTGSTGEKAPCSTAKYEVYERFENVSKVAPGSRCNPKFGTTLYYGWGIEQTGNSATRITSTGYDLFFCLGPNETNS